MSEIMVSVIIPTLNEERSIGQTIDQIPKDREMEIMIIDGLSRDRTREIAREKGARVVEEKRKGYGRAYKTGFKQARGRIIVTLDGDTTYPAEVIPDMVRKLEDEGLDLISCDRIKKAEKGAFTGTHALGNWVLKVTMNILFGMKLVDSQTGMWVFRKKILKHLTITSDGMPMSEEIKIEAFGNKNVKAVEVSVPYRVRLGEKALNTWKDGIKNEMFLFKKRFRPKKLGPGEDF
ncbi:MAG: glycosyltransferase family 2 protein [Candidatus Thermoplasmatota archaeon]|nr:glycosyltransferase family 2 protein [Candidatus Thermoplasmatota archaeon]